LRDSISTPPNLNYTINEKLKSNPSKEPLLGDTMVKLQQKPTATRMIPKLKIT